MKKAVKRVSKLILLGSFILLLSAFKGIEKTEMNTIARQGLLELGIENVFITVQELPKRAVLRGGVRLDATLYGEKGYYTLYIKYGLSKDRTIELIAHELIHVLQYENGMVEKDGNVTFEGRTYRNFKNDLPYYQRPWESEAFKEGKRLSLKLKLN